MSLPAAIAFVAVTLSMDAGDAPGLAIREKALPNFNPFEAVAPSVVDPPSPPSAFATCATRALGGNVDGQDERMVPRAVEVTLTAMMNGRVQQVPPITVPIRVNSQ